MTTPRKISPGRRPDVEAALKDKYKVQFVYHEDVSTEDFDVDRSLANQARFEALNADTVNTYAEGVERNDPFPAVIAYRPGKAANQKLVIIDGNHRLGAHMQAHKPINVYEVDRSTKTNIVAIMTYSFNTTHGRPTSEPERIASALYLIDSGATQEVAAAELNLQLKVVKKAFNDRKADQRALDASVDMRKWESLNRVTRNRLLQVSTDEGFAAMTDLTHAAALGSDEVFDIVSQLNQSRSGTKQKAIVRGLGEELRGRIQDAGAGVTSSKGHRNSMTAKGRVGLMLGQILSLPDDIDGLANSYAPAERPEAAQRVLDASQKLEKLAHQLDPSLA